MARLCAEFLKRKDIAIVIAYEYHSAMTYARLFSHSKLGPEFWDTKLELAEAKKLIAERSVKLLAEYAKVREDFNQAISNQALINSNNLELALNHL